MKRFEPCVISIYALLVYLALIFPVANTFPTNEYSPMIFHSRFAVAFSKQLISHTSKATNADDYSESKEQFFISKESNDEYQEEIGAPSSLSSCNADRMRRQMIPMMIGLMTPKLHSTLPASALTPLVIADDSSTNSAMLSSRITDTIPVPPAESLTVPIFKSKNKEYGYFIYYRVDGSLFRATLDTGSPFLMIPGSCGANTKAKTGCYKNQGIPSGLPSTYEVFDGFEGEVEWRAAPFSFVNATEGSSLTGPERIIFGVASESIMSGPGGVFFGLIRDTDDWIRPSFLKQTSVQAMEINLKETPAPTLTLASTPIITASSSKYHDYIRLTNDLRRLYGDPVNHYVAQPKSIHVNGSPLPALGNTSSGRKRQKPTPIYVIFDTGVTGMVVSRGLFDERYSTARQNREKNLWGNVEVSFETAQGKTTTLSATKPITTPFDIPNTSWKNFRGHILVLGLSFLDENRITIDIDEGKLWID